jgi:RimJ/RimL family protein N-acetyltransferase
LPFEVVWTDAGRPVTGQTAKVTERLTTDRLVLRPVTLDDVGELVTLWSDPEVMRFLTGGKPRTRDQISEIVRDHLGSRWVAYDRSTGALVGSFALDPTGDGEYEVGWGLGRQWWGKGLATEGARALIDAAFTELAAHRIWAGTMAVNTRSRQVMERCGLRYVRTVHKEWDDPIEGVEHGDVEYGLSRSEWQAAQGQ